MHSGWWERVSDTPVLDHEDTVDPQHMPAEDKTEGTRSKKHIHVGKGQWTYAISEIRVYRQRGWGLSVPHRCGSGTYAMICMMRSRARRAAESGLSM